MEAYGIHQVRDGGVQEDLLQLTGRGTNAEVLLPTPAHHIQVEDWVVQLLWGRMQTQVKHSSVVYHIAFTIQ